MIRHPKGVWTISIITSLIFLLIIIILWNIVNNRYSVSENQVSSNAELNQRLTSFKTILDPNQHNKKHVLIPTGIFIQSFEFVKSNTVQVSGYVWQKIDKSALKKGIKPGIVFPEAKSMANMKLAYNHDYGTYKLFGWHFYGVSLLQNFNYSPYPFDIQSIWIRMWPADFTNQIILVPDLQSYLSTKSGTIFGLESDIVKQGFAIKGLC